MPVSSAVEKQYIDKVKGFGLFAKKDITKGEVVVEDTGVLLNKNQYLSLLPEQKEYCHQMSETVVICPLDFSAVGDEWFVNHSCDPNVERINETVWVASRNIKAGEEITEDYALVWANDFESSEINPCKCGAKNCRGVVTGDDWKRKDLQEKYKDCLPLFIQEKIKTLASK